MNYEDNNNYTTSVVGRPLTYNLTPTHHPDEAVWFHSGQEGGVSKVPIQSSLSFQAW